MPRKKLPVSNPTKDVVTVPVDGPVATPTPEQNLYSCFQNQVSSHLLNEGLANDLYNSEANKFFAGSDNDRHSHRQSEKALENMENLSAIAQFEAQQALTNYNACIAMLPGLVSCKVWPVVSTPDVPVNQLCTLTHPSATACNLADYAAAPFSLNGASADFMSDCIDCVVASGQVCQIILY